jgi:hypothetical protein
MDRQAFGRLGLTVATVFNAVNYLDRFLSINCHLVRALLPISIGPNCVFNYSVESIYLCSMTYVQKNKNERKGLQ